MAGIHLQVYPGWVLITKSADVADFCNEVSSAEYIAVDTEFVREKTYWPILCLIQIATPERARQFDRVRSAPVIRM